MKGIKIELFGERALFTRPEFSSERFTYEVPTPSAVRGLIESIYFHPGLKWVIDKIHVLNPIKFSNIRRNEVSEKLSASKAQKVMKSGKGFLCIDAKKTIVQRSSTILRDVRYVVEAHFDIIKEKLNPSDREKKLEDIEKKFFSITMERIRNGKMYSQPYFGCREFPANFRLWEEERIVTSDELAGEYDLGFMLYDMDYSDLKNIKPMFFHAVMHDGVLDLRNCEVTK